MVISNVQILYIIYKKTLRKLLSNCFVDVDTGAKFQVRVSQVDGNVTNINVNTVRLDIVSSGL